MANAETRLQAELRELLELHGAVVRRVNAGAVRGGRIHLAEAGTADLLVCLPGGRFLAVEVKRPGATTPRHRRELQQDFRDQVRRAGGEAIQVDSADELLMELMRIGVRKAAR